MIRFVALTAVLLSLVSFSGCDSDPGQVEAPPAEDVQNDPALQPDAATNPG